MKRVTSILLVLAMLFALCACGGENVSEEVGSAGGKEKPAKGTVKIADHVKAAMEANDRLTTSSVLRMEDGSILFFGDGMKEFGKAYSAMPNIKKLISTSSTFDIYALTDNGELYYKDRKIAENVTDVISATTNSSPESFYITGSDIFRLSPLSASASSNGRFVQQTAEGTVKLSGTPVELQVDKHDFVAVTDAGDVFIYPNGGFEEAYENLECYSWKDMALVDVAKDVESGNLVSLTIAGIQGDGTVKAEGAYAADILSWGELSYLALNDTIIVGLKKDGTLKMTGLMAEKMASEVESLKNIVAIESGYGSAFGDFIYALDADGVIHVVRWYQNSVSSYTVTSAEISPRINARKYTPDGKMYYTNMEGAWETDD